MHCNNNNITPHIQRKLENLRSADFILCELHICIENRYTHNASIKQ